MLDWIPVYLTGIFSNSPLT
uniref:Uncharacterized protein n=1 Tax=Anguilla anguilla TaxID=7936 RepID=A0A0E9VR64_ANGAN